MLLKLFSFLSLFAGLLSADLVKPYTDDFVVENNVLMSVNNKTANEVRIYANSGITSVDAHAFDGCNFKSIMISNVVTSFNAVLGEDVTVNLTKDKASYSFALPENLTVNEYACDEGFLNYWNLNIRDNIDGSICNVSKEHYIYVKALYSNLSDYDKSVVENTPDGDATIKASIKFLDNSFSSSPSQMTTREISQSVMITVILVIASFGMTAIGIFYVLKDKKVIN